jgi:hypothetical protein
MPLLSLLDGDQRGERTFICPRFENLVPDSSIAGSKRFFLVGEEPRCR